ncbi:hypothetical protein [Ructibacterium gallinarum]|uniref:Uncharacterized protein n=1 Tax=Ructibacterium gallinarum TaxID=2779355 RepID=A0A9D5M4Y2_9FIRM|nr:hypothetical protein [Ructibacterium gallinarum]MBE5040784.1 hypothetical protein [Ructibacterium gallinarum]
MRFYKVKNMRDDVESVFRHEKGFGSKKSAKRHLCETGLFGENLPDEEIEIAEIEEESYTEFLLEKIAVLFAEQLDELKRHFTELSFEDMSVDEIARECYRFDIMSNLKFVLEDAAASYFEYKALEQWLAHPDKLVERLCDRVFNRDCSDENFALYDMINMGWEA